jgi:hypothetical protein
MSGITFDMVCRDDPTGADHCTSIDPAAGDQTCSLDADCPVGATDRCDLSLHRCVAPACAKNVYLGEHCRPVIGGVVQSDRAVDPATTPCAPLNLRGLYRVAVNNYIAAGGSGFVVLKRNTSQQDTGVSLRDSLTVYLSKQPPMCQGQMTDQIIDDTDTQTPKRTIKDRWGNISCLDDKLESHDGRVRPVFQ